MSTMSRELAELADKIREATRRSLGEQAREIYMVLKYRPAMRDYPWVLEIGRREVGATGIAASCPAALLSIIESMLVSGEVRNRLFREVET